MRKLAFILASTDYGCLIVNRFDYGICKDGAYGVGFQVLDTGAFEQDEANFYLTMVDLHRHYFGTGVIALDCGANFGLHTVQLARHMLDWGSVIAIEPQERIFYALAGNIVIGNHTNTRAIHAAVGAENGILRIPVPDYTRVGSFGSLELQQSPTNEFIGQDIDYDKSLTEVRLMTIDSLQLERLDFIKIDVEGMELEVLAGGRNTINRFHPIIAVEHVKVSIAAINIHLNELGYKTMSNDMMTVAVHLDDPSVNHVNFTKT